MDFIIIDNVIFIKEHIAQIPGVFFVRMELCHRIKGKDRDVTTSISIPQFGTINKIPLQVKTDSCLSSNTTGLAKVELKSCVSLSNLTAWLPKIAFYISTLDGSTVYNSKWMLKVCLKISWRNIEVINLWFKYAINWMSDKKIYRKSIESEDCILNLSRKIIKTQ